MAPLVVPSVSPHADSGYSRRSRVHVCALVCAGLTYFVSYGTPLTAASTKNTSRDCKVAVTFRTINGHKRIVDVPITRSQAHDLQVSNTSAAAYVLEARRRYAQGLGYKGRDHGDDVWKIVPGLRVTEVELCVPGAPTETLRESPL